MTGRPRTCGASAPGSPSGWPGSASRPSSSSPRPPDEPLAAEFGPNTGPHIGRLGRGVSSDRRRRHPVGGPRPRPRDDLPAQPDHPRRDRRRHPGRWPARWSRTSAARAGPASACTSRCGSRRSSPSTGRASCAEPTFDSGVIAATALDLLRGLEDERPIRLLGVRAEMVPPEGGYDPAPHPRAPRQPVSGPRSARGSAAAARSARRWRAGSRAGPSGRRGRG